MASEGYCSYSAWASHYGGFSNCGAQTVGLTGSVIVVHGLSAMWDLPGPGIEPMSTALAGGFLTTRPHGKPMTLLLNETDHSNGLLNTVSQQKIPDT